MQAMRVIPQVYLVFGVLADEAVEVGSQLQALYRVSVYFHHFIFQSTLKHFYFYFTWCTHDAVDFADILACYSMNAFNPTGVVCFFFSLDSCRSLNQI